MESFFDRILKLTEKFPPGVQLAILLGLTLMFIVYKVFTSEKVQRALALKIQKRLGAIQDKDLPVHRIFTRREIYQNAINQIHFESINKTCIFKKILSQKLESDLAISLNFVKTEKLMELTKDELCTKLVLLTGQMVKAYEEKALDELKMTYDIGRGQKIFDCIMNSPGGFREKRVDRINRIIFQIDEYLRNSQIFDNNIERVEYFLTEVLYALRTSIFEAERTFENLNGEIDKIVANG